MSHLLRLQLATNGPEMGTGVHLDPTSLCCFGCPAGARGRTKADVDCIRHIYLDVDHGGKEAISRIASVPGMPDPNYVLNTSPGKHQLVWRATGFSKQTAEELMRGMAAHHGADPAATDCARVLRLPGFRNHKYETPHYVAVENRSNQVYRPEDFPALELVCPSVRESGSAAGARITGGASQSERDWNYALRHLARGESPASVADAIMQFRPDKPDPAYYARRTVSRAAQIISLRKVPVPER